MISMMLLLRRRRGRSRRQKIIHIATTIAPIHGAHARVAIHIVGVRGRRGGLGLFRHGLRTSASTAVCEAALARDVLLRRAAQGTGSDAIRVMMGGLELMMRLMRVMLLMMMGGMIII